MSRYLARICWSKVGTAREELRLRFGTPLCRCRLDAPSVVQLPWPLAMLNHVVILQTARRNLTHFSCIHLKTQAASCETFGAVIRRRSPAVGPAPGQDSSFAPLVVPMSQAAAADLLQATVETESKPAHGHHLITKELSPHTCRGSCFTPDHPDHWEEAPNA